MVMAEATLSGELEANWDVVATNDSAAEADAIAAMADAYEVYASDAAANTPITPAAVALGKTAMEAALVGMSAPGAGVVAIPAACIAFWIAAAIPGAFGANIAAIPPPNAALAVALAAVFPANTSGDLSTADSAAAVAAAMHTGAITGGTATFPGPVVFPIL